MYMFPHRVFQEYLAACHLAGRADFYQRAADLAREFPGHWRAVLVLAARHARAGRGVPAADALVHACSVDEWSRQNTPSESDWQAAVVAGEQLLEIGVASVESRAEHRAVRDRVVGWLAATIQQSTLSARERAQAGIVLARLGDPRPGVSVKNGLPDVDWVEIPRGPFVMGARDGENGGNEHPQFKCNLIQQPYRISRYPITVAQYQAFVEANGYETERYWTKAGWRWRRKAQVTGPEGNDVGFQVANHPRVGVSWFEAVAFCRWLGEKLKLDVRLPTEAEWERAARHSDGRIFPWGDEMDVAQRCNMEQTGMGQTCTVGTFPSGNAACGASDMAGNVFEWCCTVWLHNYKGYEKKATDELEFEGTRVLRGGAWASRLEDVRCVSRIFCTPDERKPVIGFRVVAPPIAAR
jgi:formylglycine-generating enzyme required for sulfatase activity